MPMKRDLYPDDWPQISLRIRERAGWKCEECGLPNGALIIRSTVDPARYMTYIPEKDWYVNMQGDPARLSEIPEEYWDDTDRPYVKVVLTVHHKDFNPSNCADENLACLCQRCHFIADIPLHKANSRSTRLHSRKKAILATGQLEMFEGDV